jgi:hypothetical protein
MIASLGGCVWKNVSGAFAERLSEAMGKVAEAERRLGETQAALTAATPGAGTDAPEEAGSVLEEDTALRYYRARNVAARCMCYAAHDDVHMALMAQYLQRYGDGFHLDAEEAWEDLEKEARQEAERGLRCV